MQTYDRVASFRQLVTFNTSVNNIYLSFEKIAKSHKPKKPTQFHIQDEDTAVIANVSSSDSRIFMHIITYKEGGKVGIVQNPDKLTSELEVTPYNAPIDMEFVKSQYLILFSEHGDVIWTYYNTKPSDSDFHILIKSLLEHYKYIDHSKDISFQQIVNFDQLRTIKEEGVKQIHFRVGAVADRLDFFLNGLSNNRKDALSSIQRVIQQRSTDLAALDGLNAMVSIDAGSRWSLPKLKGVLEASANAMIHSDDDDFVIETGKGNKIRRDKLTLSPNIRLKGTDATVSVHEANFALNNIMDDLESQQIAGPRAS